MSEPKPKVNHDVMSMIAKICDVSTLDSLCKVSFGTRWIAMPSLCRKVSLHSGRQLDSFASFILRNRIHQTGRLAVESPSKYVVDLEILFSDRDSSDTNSSDTDHPQEETSDHLEETTPDTNTTSVSWPEFTQALDSMCNLRSITIENVLEEIVTHSPLFAYTLLTRPKLTLMKLTDIGPLCSEKFAQAASLITDTLKLETVFLHNADVEEDDYYAGSDLDTLFPDEGMGQVLFMTRGSLKNLTVTGWDLRLLFKPSTGPLVFPHVKTLKFMDYEVYMADIPHSFPALCHFDLGWDQKCWRPCDFTEAAHHESVGNPICFRNASIAGDSLQVMEFLSSSQHTVRRAFISFSDDSDYEEEGHADIARVAPSLRNLVITDSKIRDFIWWQREVTTFPKTLTYFSVIIEGISCHDIATNICIPLSKLLADIPLEYISITLRDTKTCEDRQYADRSLHLDIATAYAMEISTLRYIDVCTLNLHESFRYESDRWDRITSWFSIVREDGDSVYIEGLDLSEGKRQRIQHDPAVDLWDNIE